MKNRFVACVVFFSVVFAPVVARAELKVGEVAPDFKLAASDGTTYSLADFRGKQAVVLAWFPKAYTSGCTLECKSLAEHGDLLKVFAMRYFMASVDPLADSKGFADKNHADFPLLSDPEKSAAKAYEVLRAPGYAARTTFYIGVDGRILAIDSHVNPPTSAQDMAATAARLGIAKR